MTVLGIDISQYEASIDFSTFASEGVEFLTARCVIGDYVDPTYHVFRDKCEAAGILFAAYAYIHSDVDVSITAQLMAENIGDPTIPVMIDWEGDAIHGAADPTITQVHDLDNALANVGLRVASYYTYYGYWQSQGAPSMSRRRLVLANYGADPAGSLRDLYALVPADRWFPLGTTVPSILQFTSNARVGGYARVDGDAFLGSLDELKATGLFKDWDDMSAQDVQAIEQAITAVRNEFATKRYYERQFIAYTDDTVPGAVYVADIGITERWVPNVKALGILIGTFRVVGWKDTLYRAPAGVVPHTYGTLIGDPPTLTPATFGPSGETTVAPTADEMWGAAVAYADTNECEQIVQEMVHGMVHSEG